MIGYDHPLWSTLVFSTLAILNLISPVRRPINYLAAVTATVACVLILIGGKY